MSKANTKKDKTLAYQPPQISGPQRLNWHFVYIILYELVLIATLWQHADPLYTLGLMFITIPLGLSAYLPYRLLSRSKRFHLLQLGVVTMVFCWFLFRLYNSVPLDKVLAESICGIGLCFILAQRTEDYDYLLLISFFMLLYGSLIPRAIYIKIFVPAFVLMLMLFYSSRSRALGRRANLKVPLRFVGRNWFFMLLHLLLTVVVAWYIFVLFPLERKPGEGIFQVSFHTENDLLNHADTRFWFKSSKLQIRPTAKRVVESDGKNATETTDKKNAPVNQSLQSNKPTDVKGQGSGASTTSEQGTDLVFRVKAPLKLYWVGKMYDRYDGREWAATDFRRRRSSYNDGIITEAFQQQITIEKWVSYQLFAAYRVQSFELAGAMKQGFIFDIDDGQAELMQLEFPRTPFRYTVTSTLQVPYDRKVMKEPPPDYWPEQVPREHYLKLPKISERLTKRTEGLIRNITKPYDKAIKLRDYLRENFPYKLEADPLPEDKELADYFVFELKTGHCEYYAGTLAVMARLSGLPSRVVTGFSPGNYNALTGFFEIHEYHAHAWTQIFIEEMGWLTFDATPPSALPSRTTPFGIGSFRDPFGDSWRVTPPEITKEAQKYIMENRAKRYNIEGEELNAAEQILLKAATAPETIREQVNQQFEKLLPGIAGEGLEKLETLAAMATEKIKGGFMKLAVFCRGLIMYSRTHWYIFIPLAVMLTATLLGLKMIKAFLSRLMHLVRERRYFNAAYAEDAPESVIQNAYLAVREQLVVIGMPRRRNMELMQYGLFVESKIPELKGHVETIFRTYSRLTYSDQSMLKEDTVSIRENLDACRKVTYQYSGLNKYLSS